MRQESTHCRWAMHAEFNSTVKPMEYLSANEPDINPYHQWCFQSIELTVLLATLKAGELVQVLKQFMYTWSILSNTICLESRRTCEERNPSLTRHRQATYSTTNHSCCFHPRGRQHCTVHSIAYNRHCYSKIQLQLSEGKISRLPSSCRLKMT